jgi:hypothetical protein
MLQVLQHAWTYKPLCQDVLGMHLNRMSLQDAAPPGPASSKHQPVKKHFEVMASFNRRYGDSLLDVAMGFSYLFVSDIVKQMRIAIIRTHGDRLYNETKHTNTDQLLERQPRDCDTALLLLKGPVNQSNTVTHSVVRQLAPINENTT